MMTWSLEAQFQTQTVARMQEFSRIKEVVSQHNRGACPAEAGIHDGSRSGKTWRRYRVSPRVSARSSVRRVLDHALLGPFTPYSRPSTNACQEASMMFSETPTAPHIRLPSVESMRTRVVAAVARCSSRMRTL